MHQGPDPGLHVAGWQLVEIAVNLARLRLFDLDLASFRRLATRKRLILFSRKAAILL